MKKFQIKHRFSGKIILELETKSFKLCVEKACELKISLGGANLTEANLGGANLEGADLGGANLGRAYLSGANLGGANLTEAYLDGAYLGRANLEGADLEGAYLGGAYLEGANLEGADLGRAYLGGAYLEGADLEGADLDGAYLGRANLTEAYLGGAKGLIAIQFKGYSLYIQKEKTKIGCEYRTNKEWLSMDFETAQKLGCPNKEFNVAYKKLIKAGVSVLKELENT